MLSKSQVKRLTVQGAPLFVIVCTEAAPADASFWSNEEGWTDRARADVFTLAEKHKLNLPMFGDWAQVKP
jgi:hypothetical protein